jgi:branched-chain amino acid transport system substrate-binding protein
MRKKLFVTTVLPALIGIALVFCFIVPSAVSREESAPNRQISANPSALSAQDSSINSDQEMIGVSNTQVLIGSCVALTGKTKESGIGATEAANAYFSYLNEKGGVHGRKIKLVTCDDAYDLDKAIDCFNSCLKDKVFAGAFFHGSPPITKYVRMGESDHLPLLAFLAGTPIIYEFRPTQFTVRPSYADEVHKLLQELWAHNIRNIAVLYENGAFGASVREATFSARKSHPFTLTEASFSGGGTDAENACKKLMANNPQAVIIGASTQSMPTIIKTKKALGWNAIYCTCSSIDDCVVEQGPASEGIIISQVMPRLDDNLPAANLYRKLLKKYYPRSHESNRGFEALVNAMVLGEALKRAGPDLTRTKFIKALESIQSFDLGIGAEYRVSYSPRNHIGWSAKALFLSVDHNGALTKMTQSDWNRLAGDISGQHQSQ